MAGYGRGILRGATGGMSNLAAALARGQQTEQGAYDAEAVNQSKLAQVLSQIRANDATTAKHDAETALLENRPQLYREQSALAAGVDIPTLEAFGRKLAGLPTQVPMGPEAPGGTMGVGSAQFDPATASRIAQALQRNVPLIAAGGAINPEQWAKAGETYQGTDLLQSLLDGKRSPQDVALAQRAMKGGDAFHFDTSGLVGNQYTGKLDESSGRAQAVTGKESALGKQATAGAAENYAQASAAQALAKQRQQELADGVNRNGAKAPVGYRWGADGQQLEPIPGGPADPSTKGAKLTKPPTEAQANALTYGARMAVADEILNGLFDEGVKTPGLIKQAASGLPIVGGALSAGINALPGGLGGPSGKQQQVEQAQRDFINAVLRRESGAVISDQEFANARQQYFPQPGDRPEVLRQKAQNRKTAISGMRTAFGEALQPEFDRIVTEARTGRQPQQAAQPAPAASGWKIERVQ